jgi:hypothetical protein
VDVDFEKVKKLYRLDQPAIKVETAEGERFGPEDRWNDASQQRLEELLERTLNRVTAPSR